ncbi:MAG: (4Fe-4S)-binding protein [Rhodospirillaceae bacterium]|nr:(4Fe-4S)-binding protein [Rhodospirillaceae bacterium]
MDKWNLIVDVARCTNCSNCIVATQDEVDGNAIPGYSAPGGPGLKTFDVARHVRGDGAMVDVHYVPKMCNHCDEAPCLQVAGGVITKRADGIVLIDPVKAKGRRDLVSVCPYGAIVWNERENVPQAWFFDAHLLDAGWDKPRAVHSCPSGALEARKVTDAAMQDAAATEKLQVLNPERGTKPRVYYKNLEPCLTHFIGGNVTAQTGGGTENVEDAAVSLLRAGRVLAETKTNAFGDFKFDGLLPGSGGYTLQAEHPSFGKASLQLDGELRRSRDEALILK